MRIENDILIPELERLLKQQKEVRFTPSGVSMRPFIEGDRDSVILTALTRPPRLGDILLVRLAAENRSYVLHRLVRFDRNEAGETLLVLQGDGNITGEEICRETDIIGIVKAIERPNGRNKWMTRGRIWYHLRPCRSFLLKIYRHTLLKI